MTRRLKRSNMINHFSDQHAFLSNFASSPMRISGKLYPTVEHLYQASKTLEYEQREEIIACHNPGKAKRLGQKVDLRADWEEIKESVMLECIRLKFRLNPKLRRKLLETGDNLLVEGNHWHDNTWGDCYCSKCYNKPGKNFLGKILMIVRKECEG